MCKTLPEAKNRRPYFWARLHPRHCAKYSKRCRCLAKKPLASDLAGLLALHAEPSCSGGRCTRPFRRLCLFCLWMRSRSRRRGPKSHFLTPAVPTNLHAEPSRSGGRCTRTFHRLCQFGLWMRSSIRRCGPKSHLSLLCR